MINERSLEGYGYLQEKVFVDLENDIMASIVRRICDAGQITRSADFQLYQLNALGYSADDIKKSLTKHLADNEEFVAELYEKALQEDYISTKELYEGKGLKQTPFKDNSFVQNLIRAAAKQTSDEMTNLSQSMGFVIKRPDGRRSMSLTAYMQDRIDACIEGVLSGGFDYNSLLKKSINEMTRSGVRWINYESGIHNRITVAARRSVMTGIHQISQKIMDRTAEELGTDTFEVSAHANARPEHAAWQGLVYSKKDLEEICGLGSVTGLCGVNCYHLYYPFISGLSKRTYTDEQLQDWANPEPIEWKGNAYTGYEATQKMRKMEAEMRMIRQQKALLQEAGEKELARNAQAYYRAVMSQYVSFANTMHLKPQKERVYIDSTASRKQRDPNNSIVKAVREGTIKPKLNRNLQGAHHANRLGFTKGAKPYDPTRSEVLDPVHKVERFVLENWGLGKPILIEQKNGYQYKERFHNTELNGIYRREDGIIEPTNSFILHYSKTGTHLIPAEPNKEEDDEE